MIIGMLNYALMNPISELESGLLAMADSSTPLSVNLLTETGECVLRIPQLGNDFLAGIRDGVLMVLPLAHVLEIRGSQLPRRVDQNIFEFLSKQRTPVRLRLNLDIGAVCWLLTVEDSLLRVAIGQGVSWVPLSNVRAMEILPVENSFH